MSKEGLHVLNLITINRKNQSLISCSFGPIQKKITGKIKSSIVGRLAKMNVQNHITQAEIIHLCDRSFIYLHSLQVEITGLI